MGQSHAGQPSVGGIGGGQGRMQQGQMGGQLGRQAVVIRQDHLNGQLGGAI